MTDVLAIVGPTASGKSALAVQVAQQCRAELIGTDSMQAYIGMDIGTATPTETERATVPHHMLDVWSIDQSVSVVEFRDRARLAIDRVIAAGRVPIVVGGSGLYVRAVLEEMDFPGTDPQVRDRWEQRLAEIGAPDLHTELAAVDPEAASHIEPNNGRRIVRALEVIELTGEPFVARLPEPVDRYPTRRIGLRIDRAELDIRIERRVEQMWAAGFVDEVRSLIERGLREARTASVALGYAPVIEFLDGTLSEGEAKQRTIDDTRRFARRQQRWFARDPRIEWFDFDAPDLATVIAGSLIAEADQRGARLG